MQTAPPFRTARIIPALIAAGVGIGLAALLVAGIALMNQEIGDGFEHRLRQEHLRQTQAAAALLQLMHERQLPAAQQQAQLQTLRETQHYDCILVLDADDRVLLGSGDSRPGHRVSAMLVDPALLRAARTASAPQHQLSHDLDGRACRQLFAALPALAPGAVLFIQASSPTHGLQSTLQVVGQLGSGIAILLALLVGLGVWLLLRLREKILQQAAIVSGLDHLGRVAAQVAHDVRNPLGIAQLSAHNLAADPALDAAQRQQVDRIQRQLGRVDAAIEDLLGRVRQQPVRLQTVELRAFLTELIAEQPNPVCLHLPSEDLLAHSDPARLRQILGNLLTNAREAVADRAEPRIELRAEQQNDHIWIEVSDNGRGMPNAIARAPFTPFQTSKPQGTGLGLAGSRRLSQNLHGDLRLIRTGADGTCFRLCLPAAMPQALPQDPPQNTPQERA